MTSLCVRVCSGYGGDVEGRHAIVDISEYGDAWRQRRDRSTTVPPRQWRQWWWPGRHFQTVVVRVRHRLQWQQTSFGRSQWTVASCQRRSYGVVVDVAKANWATATGALDNQVSDDTNRRVRSVDRQTWPTLLRDGRRRRCRRRRLTAVTPRRPTHDIALHRRLPTFFRRFCLWWWEYFTLCQLIYLQHIVWGWCCSKFVLFFRAILCFLFYSYEGKMSITSLPTKFIHRRDTARCSGDGGISILFQFILCYIWWWWRILYDMLHLETLGITWKSSELALVKRTNHFPCLLNLCAWLICCLTKWRPVLSPLGLFIEIHYGIKLNAKNAWQRTRGHYFCGMYPARTIKEDCIEIWTITHFAIIPYSVLARFTIKLPFIPPFSISCLLHFAD